VRYYFDIDDGTTLFIDEEGTEIETLDLVRDEAMRLLPDLIRDRLPDGEYGTLAAHVRNCDGHCILTTTLVLRADWKWRSIDAGRRKPV
jgi:hypothetical protein